MKKAKQPMKKTKSLPCNCESSQPFQRHVTFDFAGGGSADHADVVTIPAGKRLVVKFASFRAQVPTSSGDKILAGRLINSDVLPEVVHEVVTSFAGTNSLGYDLFVGNAAVLLFVDSGQTLKAGILKATSSANSLSQEFTISGYFVDVP